MKTLLLPALLLTAVGCTTAGMTSTGVLAPQDGGERGIMNQNIVGRFPGAVVLNEREFDGTIVGHAFRYREVGSELVIERPAEVFLKGGRYSVGHRPVATGTYSIERGTVLIVCPQSFLGLSRNRIFFRHHGKILTGNADGTGSVIELLPKS